MYCMNCGTRLGDGEKKCPLCGFVLPIISEKKGLYPQTPRPKVREDFRGVLLFITLLLVGIGGACSAMDLVYFETVEFSAFVWMGIFLFYFSVVMPRWFSKANPVIFVPVFFLCLLLCLLYLDLRYGNGWFLPFALPSVGSFALLLTAAVTLLYYLPKGRLYVFSGFFYGISLLSPLTEALYRLYFAHDFSLKISLVPLIIFFLLASGLLVIAIVPAFRQYMEKRFFV